MNASNHQQCLLLSHYCGHAQSTVLSVTHDLFSHLLITSACPIECPNSSRQSKALHGSGCPEICVNLGGQSTNQEHNGFRHVMT
ncbi:hypothetical protein T265_12165 [Opisthorchis viverrini]|uniref:Uncharacterized protein n=1 Tax=Opisthorchis viverrini TaxID=6198 RepID=A0A074Z696_OPIVI|nr:hypothetical protein T265_12165 [Opisthorchis viverrini]KER18765.1 hypothetical protein T265_12165 [Opisthorchis viverrini]